MSVPTGYLPVGAGSLNMGKLQEKTRLATTITATMIPQDTLSIGDVSPVAVTNSVRATAK